MKTPIFEMKVRRKASHTEVYLRSEILERIFREWSDGAIVNQECPWAPNGTADVYSVDSPPSLIGTDSSEWGHFYKAMTYHEFNVACLLVKGLSAGVTLQVATPLSQSMVRNLISSARTKISVILTEYAKPLEASLIINEKDLSDAA